MAKDKRVELQNKLENLYIGRCVSYGAEVAGLVGTILNFTSDEIDVVRSLTSIGFYLGGRIANQYITESKFKTINELRRANMSHLEKPQKRERGIMEMPSNFQNIS